jgi:hypothetical protein
MLISFIIVVKHKTSALERSAVLELRSSSFALDSLINVKFANYANCCVVPTISVIAFGYIYANALVLSMYMMSNEPRSRTDQQHGERQHGRCQGPRVRAAGEHARCAAVISSPDIGQEAHVTTQGPPIRLRHSPPKGIANQWEVLAPASPVILFRSGV